MEPPANEAPRPPPGSEATKLTTMRDRRDQQVEQEVVARLARVERVVEDALLGHEHVGREQRPEDEATCPPVTFMNGVSSRSVPGSGSSTGMPCGIERRSAVGQRRGDPRGRGASTVARDDADRGDARPALVLEVRLDADREGEDAARR